MDACVHPSIHFCNDLMSMHHAPSPALVCRVGGGRTSHNVCWTFCGPGNFPILHEDYFLGFWLWCDILIVFAHGNIKRWTHISMSRSTSFNRLFLLSTLVMLPLQNPPWGYAVSIKQSPPPAQNINISCTLSTSCCLVKVHNSVDLDFSQMSSSCWLWSLNLYCKHTSHLTTTNAAFTTFPDGLTAPDAGYQKHGVKRTKDHRLIKDLSWLLLESWCFTANSNHLLIMYINHSLSGTFT